MVGTGNRRTVTQATLATERARIARRAPAQAVALRSGCQTWRFTNTEGFGGDIVIWPDDGRAALIADDVAHWARWNQDDGTLTLDNGDVVSAAGGPGEDA